MNQECLIAHQEVLAFPNASHHFIVLLTSLQLKIALKSHFLNPFLRSFSFVLPRAFCEFEEGGVVVSNWIRIPLVNYLHVRLLTLSSR